MMEYTKQKWKNALQKHGDFKYYQHFIPPIKRYNLINVTYSHLSRIQFLIHINSIHRNFFFRFFSGVENFCSFDFYNHMLLIYNICSFSCCIFLVINFWIFCIIYLYYNNIFLELKFYSIYLSFFSWLTFTCSFYYYRLLFIILNPYLYVLFTWKNKNLLIKKKKLFQCGAIVVPLELHINHVK